MLWHLDENLVHEGVDVFRFILRVPFLSRRDEFFPQQRQDGVILFHKRRASKEFRLVHHNTASRGLIRESDEIEWEIQYNTAIADPKVVKVLKNSALCI